MPTGREKFKAPLPAPVWTEPFQAVRRNILCPQAFVFPGLQIDENNCLLVNVFVPDTEETNLPVVVFVHGGGFKGGSGNFLTPYDILEKGNFIAVNFNYRVNVHGFLCLGTEDIPGNAGMKDQVAALRWVNRNIDKFGGNPNDVSISGQSAGASSVELLLLSETTSGLFNKVSLESGTGVALWSMQLDPLENAKRMARELNFTNFDDVYALKEFFKTASFDQLTKDLFSEERDSTMIFAPCIERDNIGSETFLTKAPVDIIKKGNFSKLPMLMGFANSEGLIRASMFNKWKNEMNENFVDFMPADLQFESEKQKEDVANRIKTFYLGDKSFSEETAQRYVDFFGDVMFNYPTLRSLKYQIESGNKNVHLYEYSYAQKYDIGFLQIFLPQVDGAVHGSQTMMLLETPPGFIKNEIEESESYKKMRFLMKQLWINFFKIGKPVPEATSDFPEGWPAVSTANGSPYMSLNIPPKLNKTPLLQERFRFWDEIYETYYRTPIPPPKLPTHYSEL